MPLAEPGPPPEGAEYAVQAWNLMDGLEWSAIPLMVARFGIEDVDVFVSQLIAIREHKARKAASAG